MSSPKVIANNFSSAEQKSILSGMDISVIKDFLYNGSVQVDMWGARIITASRTEGHFEIGEIADRIKYIVGLSCEGFSKVECDAGLECIQKMREFYKVSDAQIQNSKLFTRICSALKDFFSFLVSPFGSSNSRSAIEVPGDLLYAIGPFNIEEHLQSRKDDIAYNSHSSHFLSSRCKTGSSGAIHGF